MHRVRGAWRWDIANKREDRPGIPIVSIRPQALCDTRVLPLIKQVRRADRFLRDAVYNPAVTES